MSNYINNLIARNQNTAEVVRPRLPSLFEPPLVEARTGFDGINEAVNPVVPLAMQHTANEETRPRAPQAGPVESNTVRANPIPQPPEDEPARDAQITNAPSTRAELPDWRGIQTSPQRNESSISPPLATEKTIVQPTSALPAPERVEIQNRQETDIYAPERMEIQNRHQTDIHSIIDQRRDETPPRVVEEAPAIRLSPGPAAPPQLVTEAEQSRQQSRQQPGSQANASPLVESPIDSTVRRPAHQRVAQQGLEEAKERVSPADSNATRIVVQPRLSRREGDQAMRDGYHSGQGRLAPQPHDPPPMPTINVTIGRIEVKAMPPAVTRPQAQKNAGQLMSLDEYMRRRNRGGDSK